MKQYHSISGGSVVCSLAILGSSCATMDSYTRSSVATQSGAIIGGGFGAALGDHIGGSNGSFWGSMIGSVAGIAVGAAAASSYDKATDTHPVTADRHISRVQYEPAVSLVIRDILLKDRNGNQTINAGEHCQITFIIENDGERPAYQVYPILKAKGNAKKIRLSSPKSIQRISNSDKISYTVQAYASEKRKTGVAEFEITLEDGQGNSLCEETFSVRTQGLK